MAQYCLYWRTPARSSLFLAPLGTAAGADHCDNKTHLESEASE
jgi:hypothetical protein